MNGRPTKYKAEYCKAIVEHCSDGSSITSFAASIDVCRYTITNWANENDEFLVAVRAAKAKAASWWEKQGRRIALEGGGPGASTLAIFGMKNMGGDDWRDKQDIEHTGAGGGPIITIERVIIDPRDNED